MGLRETLIKRPKFAMAGAAALLAGTAAMLIFQVHGGSAATPHRAFYSSDDGATWFLDDIGKVAPFKVDGKEADRAYVFECAGKQFVGYLERLTAAGLKRSASLDQSSLHHMPESAGGAPLSEVKKPGGQKWVGADDYMRSSKVYEIVCPDGGKPQLVSP